MKPEPKFKVGQKVYAFAIGVGKIATLYYDNKKKEYKYGIDLAGGEFSAGNVPEDFINLIKINGTRKNKRMGRGK